MDLLAPAGNYQKFIAGLLAGADAFYLGLEKFSARSSAGNFSYDDLCKAFMAAKIHHKKIYIAVNTLIHENEISDVVEAIGQIAHFQPAGLIIQDLALVNIVKEMFPQIPLVASTQMSVHNLAGVRFLEDNGFDQAVLARELSVEEIRYIKNNSTIKLEVFLHGAMCFSYSGQCLFSSMIGGRSGNRGQCAQICRKRFTLDQEQSGCLLSPKDLDGTSYIHQLKEIGVATLKIEGRMRSPQYVFAAVRYYLALLDGLPATEIQKRLCSLQIAFDRGSSTGYFGGRNDDLVDIFTSANHGLHLGEIRTLTPNCAVIAKKCDYQLKKGDGIAVRTNGRSFGFVLKEEPINTLNEASVLEQLGQFKSDSEIFVTSEAALNYLESAIPKIDLTISLWSDGDLLKVALPQLEKNFELPLDKAKSEQDFNAFLHKKITNYEHELFRLLPDKIAVENGWFLAYSQLRDRLTLVLADFIEEFKNGKSDQPLSQRVSAVCSRPDSIKPLPVFLVDNEEQLAVCRQEKVAVCLSYDFFRSCRESAVFNEGTYQLLLPPMIKDQFYAELAALPENILPLASNPGEVYYFSRAQRPVAASWHLNIANSGSAGLLFSQGVTDCMLSLETDLTQFAFNNSCNYSILAFGRLPVMTTQFCLVKNNYGCRQCKESHSLTDEKGAAYIVQTNSFCQNTIFFHTPLFLGSSYQKFLKYPLRNWLINLSGYSPAESRNIVTYFRKGCLNGHFGDAPADLKLKLFNGRYQM